MIFFVPRCDRTVSLAISLAVSAASAVWAQQAGVAAGGRLPVERRVWPAAIEAPASSLNITIAEENPAERRYVYRSKAFEFVAQDKLAGSVMRDIARTFEATRALVQALPWGIEPKPPAEVGYFQATLYVSRDEYAAAGGPENSGGFYSRRDRVFRIPFANLGLEKRGSFWFRNLSFKESALVHEITHQMMHDFLPFLPIWVIEGTAEYTEALPFSAGKFSAAYHEHGVRTYVRRWRERGIFPMKFRPFSRHMTMTREEWDALSKSPEQQAVLYYQSLMLAYYFCHLDGDGKGTRFLKYLDAIARAHDEWEAFFKKPGVERTGEGYRYPRSVTPPAAKRSEEYGLEIQDILLEGRSPAELDAAVKAGFRKMNINL
jgi:hypothetical protein